MDGHFDEYHIPILKDIDNPSFIEESKLNLDTAAYENI